MADPRIAVSNKLAFRPGHRDWLEPMQEPNFLWFCDDKFNRVLPSMLGEAGDASLARLCGVTLHISGAHKRGWRVFNLVERGLINGWELTEEAEDRLRDLMGDALGRPPVIGDRLWVKAVVA